MKTYLTKVLNTFFVFQILAKFQREIKSREHVFENERAETKSARLIVLRRVDTAAFGHERAFPVAGSGAALSSLASVGQGRAGNPAAQSSSCRDFCDRWIARPHAAHTVRCYVHVPGF